MISAPNSIRQLLTLDRIETGFQINHSLKQELDRVVRILREKIKIQKVENLSEDLLEDFFSLRRNVVSYLAEEKIESLEYSKVINEVIAKKIQFNDFSKLATLDAEILDAIDRISNSIFSKYSVLNFDQLKKEADMYSYEHIRLLANGPLYFGQAQKKWIDSSLKIEMGIIISDLILSKKIKFSSSKIEKDLIPFLKKYIIEYGAYSIFFRLWSPKSESSLLINNMQILAEKIQINSIFNKPLIQSDFPLKATVLKYDTPFEPISQGDWNIV